MLQQMSEPSDFDRQKSMLRDLVALVEKRGRLEIEIQQTFEHDVASGEEAFASRRKEIVSD